jgi:hypothetical protein
MTSANSAFQWRGYINQITYGIDLQGRVSDSLVARLADELIGQRYFTHPVEDYYQAAVAGLQSGENVSLIENQNEEATRNLLARLIHILDERRPWPEPPFISLETGEWLRLRDAPAVGRIPMAERDVQTQLHRIFSELPPATPDERVLILRLRTGQDVALLSPTPNTSGIQLITSADPESTLSAFQDLTGIDVEPA